MGKHDAVAGANDRLGIDLVGKSYARTKVLVVVIDRSGAVAGVGASASKLQRSIEAGDRVGEIRIEEAHAVVHFSYRREEVVTKAKIEGQLRSDFPVVLNVGRDGAEARAKLLLDVLGEACLIDLANEEAGVRRGRCLGLRHNLGEVLLEAVMPAVSVTAVVKVTGEVPVVSLITL